MVINVQFLDAKRSQPMRPSPDMTAAEGNEDQFASLLHVRQVGQRRIVFVQDGRNAMEKLDVVRAFDNEQDASL